MVKYHISSDGTPNICEARKKPCTLGEDKPHFKTKEAAREHYEKDNASKTIAKPLTKNNLSRTGGNTPPHILKELSKNAEKPIPLSDFGNVPPHVLEKLSNDEDKALRERVLEHRNTPPHILEEMALEKMSKDKFEDVRASAALKPNAPIHVLETLSKDKSPIVRASVARNRNAPPHVLEKLSKDKFADVRYSAGWNRNTPIHALKKLSKDKDLKVRNTATITLESLKYSSK